MREAIRPNCHIIHHFIHTRNWVLVPCEGFERLIEVEAKLPGCYTFRFRY
jgi:hypothetical protein